MKRSIRFRFTTLFIGMLAAVSALTFLAAFPAALLLGLV